MAPRPIDPALPFPEAPEASSAAWLIRFTEVRAAPGGDAGQEKRIHVGSLRLSSVGALESDIRSAMLHGLLALDVFPRMEAEDWSLSSDGAVERLAGLCREAVGARFQVEVAVVEEDEEERFRETWGSTSPDWGGKEAPWAPLPLRQARKYIQDNPDAQVEIIFPTVYEEDRAAMMKDLATAQSVGAITHRRMSEQMAKELGQEQYDYDTEQEEIKLHPGPPPPGMPPGGAPPGGPGGAALGNKVQATLKAPDEVADPSHRPGMDAPARARFRNDQKAKLTEALDAVEVEDPDDEDA